MGKTILFGFVACASLCTFSTLSFAGDAMPGEGAPIPFTEVQDKIEEHKQTTAEIDEHQQTYGDSEEMKEYKKSLKSERRDARRDVRDQRDELASGDCGHSKSLGYTDCKATRDVVESAQTLDNATSMIGSMAVGVAGSINQATAAQSNDYGATLDGAKRTSDAAGVAYGTAALVNTVNFMRQETRRDKHDEHVEEMEASENLGNIKLNDDAKAADIHSDDVYGGQMEARFQGDKFIQTVDGAYDIKDKMEVTTTYDMRGPCYGSKDPEACKLESEKKVQRQAEMASREDHLNREYGRIRNRTKEEQEAARAAASDGQFVSAINAVRNAIGSYFAFEQSKQLEEAANNLNKAGNNNVDFGSDEVEEGGGEPVNDATLQPGFGQEGAISGSEIALGDDFSDDGFLDDPGALPLSDDVPFQNVPGQFKPSEQGFAGSGAEGGGFSGGVGGTGKADTRGQDAPQAQYANIREDAGRYFNTGATPGRGGARGGRGGERDGLAGILDKLLPGLNGEKDYNNDSVKTKNFGARQLASSGDIPHGGPSLFDRVSTRLFKKARSGVIGKKL